ncbi:MAG TPA: hypothetical protein DDW25_00870, partial [Ktedonobacter sp.]|nr:hypothetical protein [Ktedonobacter sp.]
MAPPRRHRLPLIQRHHHQPLPIRHHRRQLLPILRRHRRPLPVQRQRLQRVLLPQLLQRLPALTWSRIVASRQAAVHGSMEVQLPRDARRP